MRVLKVVAEGSVTSFRYPHFMHGIQPTFEMPPPATIYGHICSTLGEWFSPEGIVFAVHFTYQKKFQEIEHTHVVSPATGKLPESKIPKVLEGAVNPFTRELLFMPRLTLYINRPEWEGAFRKPHFPVVLGRSQDLFSYTKIDVVELVQEENAYFEHTLAPFTFARKTGRGITVLMPCFLDYYNNRQPQFSRYIVLHRRIHTRDMVQIQGEKQDFWVDPESPEIKGAKLGLLFHSWTDSGGKNEGLE